MRRIAVAVEQARRSRNRFRRRGRARCGSTVERRARSKEKNEECTTLEASAAVRQIVKQKPRRTQCSPGLKYDLQRLSQEHSRRNAQLAACSAIARRPLSCSNRETDSQDRTASSRSTAWSVGQRTWERGSPQTAIRTAQPATKPRMLNDESSSQTLGGLDA